MLVVSEATKTVFFVPEYPDSKVLRRLFWYLDNPKGDINNAMASRHFGKRAKYKIIPFADVDLTGKEEYAKVALVVGPARALSQLWRLHSRVKPKWRPEEAELLASAGLANAPDFRSFIENIDGYAKAMFRVREGLDMLTTTLGEDPSYFDAIIRLDEDGAFEAYLKSKTDIELPKENFTLKYELPEIISPKDVEIIGKIVEKDYAFLQDACEMPEKILSDAADRYVKAAKNIPEFVRHDHKPSDEFHVVIIIMDTPEVAKQFVNYYAAVGASKIHMYFDNPDDPAIDMVKDHPQVNAIACNDDFWQGKRKYAVEGRQSHVYTHAYNTMERGWLLTVDADEFVVADKPLPELFASMPEDARVVRFDSTEAVWKLENSSVEPFSADFVRHQVSQGGWRSIAKLKDPAVRSMFRRGLLAHRSGKYAVRVGTDVSRLSLHRVFFNDRYNSMHPPKEHPRGKLIHFDAISFGHWKTKFVRRISKGHGFAGFGPGRDVQHAGMRKVSEDDYEEFHNNLYKISQDEQDLQANLKSITRLRIFEDLPDYFE